MSYFISKDEKGFYYKSETRPVKTGYKEWDCDTEMIDITETENIELLYAMEDMDFDEVREVKEGGIYDYWNLGDNLAEDNHA